MATTAERYEPTLSGLPVQLKQRIVAILDDSAFYDETDWEDDSEAGDGEGSKAIVEVEGQVTITEEDLLEDPADQRTSSLSALSLVSKEWHAVVSPVLWRVRLPLYSRVIGEQQGASGS